MTTTATEPLAWSEALREEIKNATSTDPENALVRARDIALLLGVSGNQVYMWQQRSDRNGFPAPVAYSFGRHNGGGKRRHPLWRWSEILEWHSSYDVYAQRVAGGKHAGRAPDPNRGGRNR